MAERPFPGHYGKTLAIDVCPRCGGLWFDTRESLQLSPAGTLRLFRAVHGARRSRFPRDDGPHSCPRCDQKLVPTRDMAHGNPFHYQRCAQGHGHFITFFQFLREKGLVRALKPRELGELRKHVDSILCSDCGSPLRLANMSVCERCRAPLSILDPQCVRTTLEDAQRAAGSRQEVAPHVAAQLLMSNLGLKHFQSTGKPTATKSAPEAPLALTGNDSSPHWSGDLVELGLDLVGDVLLDAVWDFLTSLF
jgi:hypothetical protein